MSKSGDDSIFAPGYMHAIDYFVLISIHTGRSTGASQTVTIDNYLTMYHWRQQRNEYVSVRTNTD